jgi:plastocyanin
MPVPYGVTAAADCSARPIRSLPGTVWPRMRIPLTAAILLCLAVAGPTAADNGQLTGSVGPGYVISLTDSTGAAVTHLDPGTYTLVVHDQSDIHNFHLNGPGVDVSTAIDFVGNQTFTITVVAGTYTFVCDAHFGTMKGSFTVGAVTTPPPRPPAAKTASFSVGPGNKLGAPARLTAGRYSITVRDLSTTDDLHFKGPGVDRKTGVATRGTVRWAVTLKAGTYRLWSDRHPTLRRTLSVG